MDEAGVVVFCGVLWCVVVYCGVLWCVEVWRVGRRAAQINRGKIGCEIGAN